MLTLDRASAEALNPCSWTVSEGLHIVIGTERDGTQDLIGLVAGSTAPRSGAVRVQGRPPHRSPDLRRGIAAVRGSEELLPARSVRDVVRLALSARGLQTTAENALAQARLSHWAERRASSLDAAERRSIAACVAFSIEQPLLAVLHEPLAYLPGWAPELVMARIVSWTARGALVLCTTSSPATARALGGNAWVLDRGRLTNITEQVGPADLAPGQPGTLLIRTPRARELAALLSSTPGVSAAAFDETWHAAQVRVQGMDLKTLALAIAHAARTHAIPIEAIVPGSPELEVARAASAGYLRAAYDAAYQRALADQYANGSSHAGG
jgi:ABC-type taurine transport system ATPase subunit